MRIVITLLVLTVLLAGCGQASVSERPTPRPAPTIAPFFTGGGQARPSIQVPTPQPRPTIVVEEGSQSILEATARAAAPERRLDQVTIFDERLAAGWTLENSWGQEINPESSVFASSGFVSLEAQPTTVFGGVMFALTPESREIYPRADVIGVRFAVSGGVRYLEPHNVIVKVLGSNDNPYFVQDDTSVRWPVGVQTAKPIFDEVNLELLGMQRDLPPGDWAEIELLLDGYDQVEYEYVTGLVLMNDLTYVKPFFVDNVRLLLRVR